MRRASAPLAALTVVAALAATPGLARAQEQSIIRSPGDHPAYIFEAEPHILVGFAGPFDDDGRADAHFAVGFRGAVHIYNGFIPSINDSVAVGFGFDIATNGRVFVPIVLQWNFWLSTHWSVFGEPGIAFSTGDEVVYPTFFAGGRFHITDRIAITARVGYPELALGVSFLL
jgi:hypothetical protein